MTNWQVTDRDRELWDRELESFVPPRIFDAHLHLYEQSHFRNQPPALCAEGPPLADWSEFQRQIRQMMPRRQIDGLAFGFPAVTVDFENANAFVAGECRAASAHGQMLIHPGMDAEFIRQEVQRLGFVGLKPYHLFAAEKPTFKAPIPSFLTPSHMQVADELGLTITLHIVRARALADPANQEVLGRYAATYPNARLILAHAARGFNPHHTMAGIHALRGLGNVWFDTSAVTDAGAIEAIVKTCGHRRVLYGSDFPVSHLRGRCVALGNNFLWLTPENTQLAAAYGEVQFSLIGLESLRTLKVAALGLGLSDEQLEDVFLHNAEQLWS